MEYTGDMTSLTVWEALSNDKNSHLIDVRTISEWNFVGIPDLSSIGKELICLEWLTFPDNETNKNFCEELNNYVNVKNSLYFLCRSGSRSRAAATLMAREGFSACYNVSDGFEGKINEFRKRSTIDGWKFNGLPWVQS